MLVRYTSEVHRSAKLTSVIFCLDGYGMLPQLSADVLIETALAPRVAIVASPLLEAIATPAAYTEAEAFHVGCEIFDLGSGNWLVHHRSKALEGQRSAHIASVATWLQQTHGATSCLVLASECGDIGPPWAEVRGDPSRWVLPPGTSLRPSRRHPDLTAVEGSIPNAALLGLSCVGIAGEHQAVGLAQCARMVLGLPSINTWRLPPSWNAPRHEEPPRELFM